jgi:hypothetical protein
MSFWTWKNTAPPFSRLALARGRYPSPPTGKPAFFPNHVEDDQVAADILVVDCAGVNSRRRGTYDKSAPPPGQQIDQNKAISDRDSLLNAYYDYLVGYKAGNGEKVYVPFDPSESQKYNPSRGSLEYGGVRVVEYQRIFPVVGENTSTPPPNAISPDSPNDANYDYETASRRGQLVEAEMETNIALAGGQTFAVQLQLHTLVWGNGQIEYSVVLPPGAQPRNGDPISWRAGAWQCEGQGFDGCTDCCRTTLSNTWTPVQILATSLAGACALTGFPAAIPCWITAGIFVAGLVGVNLLRESACNSGCQKSFYRVPGAPPR